MLGAHLTIECQKEMFVHVEKHLNVINSYYLKVGKKCKIDNNWKKLTWQIQVEKQQEDSLNA